VRKVASDGDLATRSERRAVKARRDDAVVSHPTSYDENDRFLADLRRLALALPETAEVEAWGRPTFRAGKKMFAMFVHQDPHGFAVVFKPEPGEKPALLADERFYDPPYTGPAGWVGLDLTVGVVDWREVGELLEGSYRQVALKRMLAALDTRERVEGPSRWDGPPTP
jgi:hypothetical protein